MTPQRLLAFINRLRAATHFEDAALETLREMLDAAQAALQQSRYAKRGRVLRAMVHLRPADGYRRLIVLENTPARDGSPPAHLPSASAWRWVAQQRCTVGVDVPIGRVRALHSGAARQILAAGSNEAGSPGYDSMHRLLSREVTHLYAVPLRARRATIEGMTSIELQCPTAVGEDFLLAALGDPLELLADIGGPYLTSLPLRPAAAVQTDALLPVVGATMAGLVQMLRVFAQQDETLLLGGPTGAGKSRLARWCHETSPRRSKPFEVLDLNTIPEELQMAELFGWRKGAFTGAARDTPGCVTRARGGTLFIDEIDKLSPKAQAGLLHLLEARTYRPLGDGGREQQADVRFLVGTNADLFDRVQRGQFREDLYYRINVLPIQVPPLSDRRDEIPLWTRHMAARRHHEATSGGDVRITVAAERLLADHEWPGNLRQLDNVVRRAYALALMAHGGVGGDIVLDEPCFARALTYERTSGRRSALDSLRAAAAALVEEAERLGEGGVAVDLDLCDGFRGIVLATAVQRLGSRDAAFRLFGKEAQVQSRNHHKMLRRELDKVDALCRALGEESVPFAALRDDDER